MIRSTGALLLLGVLLLLAAGVAPAHAADATLLRLDLSQGDAYHFAMKLDQNMTMELGAMGFWLDERIFADDNPTIKILALKNLVHIPAKTLSGGAV